MAVSPSGVLSSDLKQFVGVCVSVCVSIRNNLCLGLEVEVISLIGTLPPHSPPHRSPPAFLLSSLSALPVLFSAISSPLSPLVICP